MKTNNNKLSIFLLLGIFSAVTLNCSFSQDKAKGINVMTIKVKPQYFEEKFDTFGKVRPLKNIDIEAEKGGVVLEVNSSSENKVEAGSTLARIALNKKLALDFLSKKKQEKFLEEELISLQKKLNWYEQLFKLKEVNEEELENLTLKIKTIKHKSSNLSSLIAEISKRLEDYGISEIKSPYRGVIDKVYIKAGDKVRKGQKIVSLMPVSSIIEAKISEKDMRKFPIAIDQGQYAETTLIGDEQKKYTGKVVSMDLKSGIAEIDLDKADELLYPNLQVKISVFLIRQENALVVPADVFLGIGKQRSLWVYDAFLGIGKQRPLWVYVVSDFNENNKTGKILLQQVMTSYLSKRWAVISEGLEPENLVITRSEGNVVPLNPAKVIWIDEDYLQK